MKKYRSNILVVLTIMTVIFAFLPLSCSKDDGKLPTVTTAALSNVTHNSAVSGGKVTDDGGLLITAIGVVWNTAPDPTVSDFYTSDGRYTIDGVEEREFVSLAANLEPETKYYLRAYAANEQGVAYGETLTFETDEAGAIIHNLTIDMVDAWTQETSEGPLAHLIDGNTSTYWHSAWSQNVEPLPHWIEIVFDEEKKIGGFDFTFRQPSGITDRPNHFDFQVSNNGTDWTTVWESPANLPVEPVDELQSLHFGENFSSRYFRIRILDTYGSRDWTHMSTITVYEMRN